MLTLLGALLPEPPSGHRHEPIAELRTPRDCPPEFYNIQKLDLCSKTDITKTAWINACIFSSIFVSHWS